MIFNLEDLESDFKDSKFNVEVDSDEVLGGQ